MKWLLVVLIGCASPPPKPVTPPPVDAPGKAGQRIDVQGAMDDDAVVFTIRFPEAVKNVRFQVYGTNGLRVAAQTPKDAAFEAGAEVTARAEFTAPPPAASVVAHVRAEFKDGRGMGIASVRVGGPAEPIGVPVTTRGRPGIILPASPPSKDQ